MHVSLDAKAAIITGAGQGIGQTMAVEFARAGARLVVNDIVQERADETVALIREEGGEAIAVAADVSATPAVQAMVATCVATYGGVDILVNNASIVRRGLLVTMSDADFDDVVRVDLRSVFLCAREVLPHMTGAGAGSIVNISSVASLGAGSETRGNYAAAKAGVNELTKVIAREAGPQGVRANVIAPGIIDTPIWRAYQDPAAADAFAEAWVAKTALRTMGRVEDISNLALFLASDAARYVTAQVIAVDGGYCDRV